MAGLTAKQEQFAKNVGIRNMGLAEAYRASYNTENMKDKTIRSRAAELHKHSGITAAIRSHQEATTRAMIASVVSDKELVLERLRHHSVKAESETNQIRAVEVLGRTVPGLFKGEESVDPPKSAAEIQKELAEYLAEYGVTVDSLSDKAH